MSTPTLDAHADTLKLRDRRLQAGLSQQKLAQAAGCSIAMVRLLEGGFTPSRSAVLERVLAVLADYAQATIPVNKQRPGRSRGVEHAGARDAQSANSE